MTKRASGTTPREKPQAARTARARVPKRSTRDGAARSSVEGPVMGLERRGCVAQPWPRANWKREEPVDEAKPFSIPKREVWEAFKRVRANQGAAGVDGQSIAEFEANLSGNLYKLWNRMSSGSYFPPSGARAWWRFRKRMGASGRWAFQRLPTASPRRSPAAIWSRPWSRCSTPTPTATGPANLRSMPWERPASAAGASRWKRASGTTLGSRSRHQGLLRQHRLGADAQGGSATYGLSLGFALHRALAEGAGADGGRQHRRAHGGDAAGWGEPAMRTLCCYAVILRRRWMTRRCSGTGPFEKRGQ